MEKLTNLLGLGDEVGQELIRFLVDWTDSDAGRERALGCWIAELARLNTVSERVIALRSQVVLAIDPSLAAPILGILDSIPVS